MHPCKSLGFNSFMVHVWDALSCPSTMNCAVESRVDLLNVEEGSPEGNLTHEDQENYLIASVYIKIGHLFEDGFG